MRRAKTFPNPLAIPFRVCLAFTLLLHLTLNPVTAADFRLSFLDEKPALDDTCQLLATNGFSGHAVATFRKLVEHHNQNGNRVDKSKFPPSVAGYYHFQNLADFSHRVQCSFCATPGDNSLDQSTLMCFDVALLLLKGADCAAPRVDQDFAAKRFVYLNPAGILQPADPTTFSDGQHLLWPPQGYEYLVGEPRSKTENQLTLSLRATRRFTRPIANNKPDLRAAFAGYLAAIGLDGFKFPEHFKLGLGFWASVRQQYLQPDHTFLCFPVDGRQICLEKDNCKGPYVRLEFKSEDDLAHYVYWLMDPARNNPSANQDATSVLVSLNDHLIGVFQPPHDLHP